MRNPELAATQNAFDTQGAEFLRMPSVLRRTGLGRSTIYRLMSQHKFPPPVRLSGRAIAWRRDDLDRWSAALQSASAPSRHRHRAISATLTVACTAAMSA